MVLATLIDLIYAAAADPEAWPPAMTAIADVLGARAMSLTIVHSRGEVSPFVVAPRTDPEWLREYSHRWAVSNPVRERGYAMAPGETYDFERLDMPRSEFDRTAFYNEFCAPQRLNSALIMIAAMDATAASAVGFYRASSEGIFQRNEERLLRALGPHVRRAVSLNRQLAQIEMQRDSAIEMLNRCDCGAMLVDAQARVLFANRGAEDVLNQGESLYTAGGRLATRSTWKTTSLQEMIAGNTPNGGGGILSLPRPDGTTLTLEVIPMRIETHWVPQPPAALVFVKISKAMSLPSHRQIQLLFNLTPAQAALARELLHGDGIPAAATRLGVSRSTARTHLLELFQKTGTNRQAELVRLILQRIPVTSAIGWFEGSQTAA